MIRWFHAKDRKEKSQRPQRHKIFKDGFDTQNALSLSFQPLIPVCRVVSHSLNHSIEHLL